MFPNVLERIRGTPARLEDRLRNVPKEILTRESNDQWSVQEQAAHLLDLENLNLQRMNEYEAGIETLTAADVSNRQTHEAGYNQRPIDSILSGFRKQRLIFVQRLEGANESFIGHSALHPRLKTPMRLIDYAYFIAEHDDHHLARISDLLR
jgi:DinB superfamily